MTATRRLAAIMAINVVGYSRLMGEDEAQRLPQSSDSIPFADFRPPQAMPAKRRYRSKDRSNLPDLGHGRALTPHAACNTTREV
jgi:hypothetical protein